jgi:hypothetical protein
MLVALGAVLLVSAVSGAAGTAKWRSRVRVFVPPHRVGGGATVLGKLGNFRLQGKRHRSGLPHLPPANAYVTDGVHARSSGVVLVGDPSAKKAKTHARVYYRDTIAIPIHTANVSYSIKNGVAVGITDRLSKTSTGKNARLRLLLVRFTGGFGDAARVTVKEKSGKVHRYTVETDTSATVRMHYPNGTTSTFRTAVSPIIQ